MTESNYSSTFYTLIGAGVIGIMGSAYYLYSLYGSSNEKHRKVKEKSSCQDPDISLSFKGKLSEERALKLMAYIHNKTEHYITNTRPEIEDLRRKNIDNPETYDKICNEMLELKNEAFKKYTKEIEETYGYTYDEISKVLEPLGAIEMEEKLLSYSIPKFADNNIKNKDFIYEAFDFYGKRCIEQMKNVQGLLKESSIDQKQREYFVYQLMILKYKTDDELFLKYRITEYQLKYLLFEYKLHNDTRVQDTLKQISEYEDFFT